MEKSKDQQIQEIRTKISYWIEQLKVTNNQIDRGVISDKILEAKKELGKLESKSLDRIKKVDIIDAAPVAVRLEMEKGRKSRSGAYMDKNRVIFKIQ